MSVAGHFSGFSDLQTAFVIGNKASHQATADGANGCLLNAIRM